MTTDCRSSTRSDALWNLPPLDADLITTRASDPRGITTAPSASLVSRVTTASNVCPSFAVAESIGSLVRTETSLPSASSYVLVVTGGGGGSGGGGGVAACCAGEDAGCCGTCAGGTFSVLGCFLRSGASLPAVFGASPYSIDLTCPRGILRSMASSPATTTSFCELATIVPGTLLPSFR